MAKKKMSPALQVIIFIMILIGASVGGWLFGEWFSGIQYKNEIKEKENVDNDAEKKENDEGINSIQLDIGDANVLNIFSGMDTYASTYGDNNCGVLNYDYFRDSKGTVSNLNKSTPTYAALNYLNKLGLTFNGGETFTRDQMHEAISKLFGKGYVYVDDDIEMCPSISYDSTTGVYTVGAPGCGGTCAPSNQKKLVNALMIGDKVELYVRVLFVKVENNNKVNYYGDFAKNKLVQVQYAEDGSIALESFEAGSLYKVTFKEEDGNYVFVSSELSK